MLPIEMPPINIQEITCLISEVEKSSIYGKRQMLSDLRVTKAMVQRGLRVYPKPGTSFSIATQRLNIERVDVNNDDVEEMS